MFVVLRKQQQHAVRPRVRVKIGIQKKENGMVVVVNRAIHGEGGDEQCVHRERDHDCNESKRSEKDR